MSYEQYYFLNHVYNWTLFNYLYKVYPHKYGNNIYPTKFPELMHITDAEMLGNMCFINYRIVVY